MTEKKLPEVKEFRPIITKRKTHAEGMADMMSARQRRIERSIKDNTEVIQQTTQEINRLAGEDLPKIPEQIFVKYFLPYFAKEEGMYPPDAGEEWLKISNNGMLHVNVVDEIGQTIVTVPPRYFRSLINIRTKRDRVSISDAMATFSDLASSSPIRAKNYFDNVIQPRTTGEDKRKEAIERYTAELNKVLEHYKKPLQSVDGKNAPQTTNDYKPTTVHSEDDML